VGGKTYQADSAGLSHSINELRARRAIAFIKISHRNRKTLLASVQVRAICER
jgi:hypothetical protein